MKLRSVFLGLVVLVVLAGVFASYYVYSSLDGIVKAAIERYGSEILGTPVRVASVSIQLGEGRGSIHGLRIANPRGFASGDAVSFGEITLDLDVDSLRARDPIVISLVRVGEPFVLLATDAEGYTNLQAIQENTASYAGSGMATESDPEPSEGPPILLVIRRLSIAGGRVAADLTATGGKATEVKLPPLNLSKVGGSKGASPGELGTQVATAFVESTLTAVARSQIHKQLDGLIDQKLEGEEAKAAKGVLRGLLGN
jgi:hypothetical protein